MEQFARFLPNRPIGEDLYDGQSQDRIADLKVCEPLLKGNIEQASELKTELIKLYGNTQNDCLRALIGRLNIIVKPENEKSDMQTEK